MCDYWAVVESNSAPRVLSAEGAHRYDLCECETHRYGLCEVRVGDVCAGRLCVGGGLEGKKENVRSARCVDLHQGVGSDAMMGHRPGADPPVTLTERRLSPVLSGAKRRSAQIL